MKAYFDDNGALVVEAENNTEMLAIRQWWSEGNEHGVLSVVDNAHLKFKQGLAADMLGGGSR